MIRQKLIEVYIEGYSIASLDNYVKTHNLSVADFGLPSGTIWIIKTKVLSFSEAQKLGLQFPTKGQLEELMKCKWSYNQFDVWHEQVKGPNGFQTGVFNSWQEDLCVYTSASVKDDDFMVEAYLYDKREHKFNLTKVYSGDKYSTLFVVPNNLNKVTQF